MPCNGECLCQGIADEVFVEAGGMNPPWWAIPLWWFVDKLISFLVDHGGDGD